MRQSAKQGCHLCGMIQYCLDEISWYETGIKPVSGPDGIVFHRQISSKKSTMDLKYWHKSSTLNIHRYEHTSQTRLSFTSPHLLRVLALHTHGSSCLQNYGPCTTFQSRGFLPSRIINVSDPKRPFIEHGEPRDERYVEYSTRITNWHYLKKCTVCFMQSTLTSLGSASCSVWH